MDKTDARPLSDEQLQSLEEHPIFGRMPNDWHWFRLSRADGKGPTLFAQAVAEIRRLRATIASQRAPLVLPPEPVAFAYFYAETGKPYTLAFANDTARMESMLSNGRITARPLYAAPLAPTQESGAQICPHGIHYANACGSCVPPRGTT